MERLHHLFEEACDRYPKRVAIIFKEKRVTYRELDALANRLARYLLAIGLKPDDRIGINLRRSIFTYASLLAILKMGGVFVPLDPEFPEDRRCFIAEDADLKAILTSSDLGSPSSDLKTIFLDQIQKELDSFSPQRLSAEERPPSQDNLCYIIYTSGTTGRPKGVMIEHPSIVNFVRVARQTYGLRPEDRVYQGMTIAFDFSIEEIWLPLTLGATIVPAPPERRLLGPELKEFLEKKAVTVLCCVPTLLATLEPPISSLRLLIVGGEPCPQELVVRWWRPGLRILNTYGPTETTVTATWCELRPGKPVTIGRPLPTYEVYLLDNDLKPVPPGEVGEICIAGPGVARGYLNREDLSRKKFVSHPHDPTKRLYRTGDLGRFNSEGEIEFLGRIDTQVKIRGYRVELSEIESVILSLQEVERVAVSLWKPTENSTELVAYCTLRKGTSLQEFRQKFYEFLKKKLPSYMIPSYLEIIDEIPTLPSGKVDRSKLPAPRGPRFVLRSKKFVPPETELEKIIAQAFSKTLGLEEVSVEDDFFEDLGGHSLLAARLVSLLRRHPALSNLSLADIYQTPTIRALAHRLEEETSRERPSFSEEKRFWPSPRRIWLCGLAQAGGLYFYLLLLGLPGLFCLYLAYQHLEAGQDLLRGILPFLALGLIVEILWSFTLPLLVKWTLLGRLQPGRYPLWGWFYWRWWLYQRSLSLSPVGYLSATPFINLYFRLLGAKIGPRVKLRTHLLHGPDLISIGAGTTISDSTHLFAYQIRQGWIHFQKIHLGRNCFVGSNSVILPGTKMEDEAFLGHQSLLPEGARIPARQTWCGSPASPYRDPELEALRDFPPSSQGLLASVGSFFGFLFAVPLSLLVPVICLIPGILILRTASHYLGKAFWVASPLAGLSFVLSLCLVIITSKKILLPRVKPGTTPFTAVFICASGSLIA